MRCGVGKGRENSGAAVLVLQRRSESLTRSSGAKWCLPTACLHTQSESSGGGGGGEGRGIRRGLGVTPATAEIIITKRNKVVMKSQ